MDRGVDELVEWLLTKIAFSGLEGLSARNFVRAVKAFYEGCDDIGGSDELDLPLDPSQGLNEADIAHASIVWKWVVKRKDVIVIPNTAGAVPLEQMVSISGEKFNNETQPLSGRASTKRKASTALAPDDVRLLLSEERQWKAIAGHGPDYKRIPLFEWKALVAIASVGTKGILQGDLTRLTGQDKRSLPTRTDSLARKGYIIKQQATLRGCRTSKIWLAQFSNHAKADVARQGLPEEVLNTPAEELNASWAPVTFSHHYTSGQVDYVAISQAFLMILKAYQAMRYCDIRPKMNITHKVPQMRALAKSSRWWARVGVIRFEPMKTGKSGQVFKDCVKFIRDPTEEEWTTYKTMPKANLKIPTSRLRKNIKKPKTAATKATAAALAEPAPLEAKSVSKNASQRIPPSPALIRLSAWNPSKPIASTFFDIIKRSGSEGTSNTELGMFNLGWPYRKFISTLTTMLSLPRSLPPHQQPFGVHAEFKRVRKTMTYTFRAHGSVSDNQGQEAVISTATEASEHPSATPDTEMTKTADEDFVFPKPSPRDFLKPGSRLKGFLPVTGLKGVTQASLKPGQEVIDDRSPGDVNLSQHASPRPSEPDLVTQNPPAPLLPGIYFGKKNSLDPLPPKGRPRNSIVMRFVSPALRNPEFYNRPLAASATLPPDSTATELPGTPLSMQEPDTSVATNMNASSKRRQSERANGSKKFRCDKCGSSYKNINGLEYHQQKSQSSCNPEWVPLPPKPALPFSPSKRGKSVAEKVNETVDSPSLKLPSTPKRVLPSRRPKIERSQVPLPVRKSLSSASRVAIHPVTLHNVLELPLSSSNHTTPNGDKHGRRTGETIVRTSSRTPGNDLVSKERLSVGHHDRVYVDATCTTQGTAALGESVPPLSPSPDYTIITNIPDHSEQPTVGRLDQMPVHDNTLSGTPTKFGSQVNQASMSPHKINNNPSTTVANGSIGQKLYGKQKMTILRKELTNNLVLQLLEQNDEVLPGDVSLYSLVVTKWSQKINNKPIPVPDWKVFQTILKGMERDRLLSIHHFGLLKSGAVKPITVVHKGYYGTASGPMPASIFQKINEVKSKCEELYPNPYVPAKFALFGKELDICRDLSQKYDNIDAPSSSNTSKTPKPITQQISTLGYDMKTARRVNGTAIASIRSCPDSDDSDEPHSLTRRQIQNQSVTQSQESQVLSNTTRRRLVSRINAKQQTQAAADDDNNARWSMEVAPPGMIQALEASCSLHFVAPVTPATYEKVAVLTGEIEDDGEGHDDDDVVELDAEADFDVSDAANGGFVFTTMHTIAPVGGGMWPGNLTENFFMNCSEKSFTVTGRFPDRKWFLRQNLPQSMTEMVGRAQFRRGSARQDVSRYGAFGAEIEAIEAWERSPEGVYLQNMDNIAPQHIFISLAVDAEHSNMEPVMVEWPSDTQYDRNNLPDEIKHAISEDEYEEVALSEEPQMAVEVPKKRQKAMKDVGGRQRRFIKRSEGNWKHRVLFPIAKRENGRWNMARAVGANIGRERETELVVAIVIIRKLLGGVDKVTDWGLFLQIYPEWSISGIRKFWIRVTKERANYIEALGQKFHTAFLEAYEKGEVAPLDYDNLDKYDWKALISWAARLETHNGVELPTTREQFDREYLLTEPKRDDDDWRDSWFHFQTSTYDRLDAVSSQHLVTPITKLSSSSEERITETDLQLARSWVRALCNNKKQTTVGIEVRDKLMELGNRDKAEMNELLELSVSQLLETKVISKAFGKGFSQVFKLNNHYDIRLKKFVHIEKYSQAIAFKKLLDESFRNNQEVAIPTNSNDGTIMAMINLQACGRLRLSDVKFPHVPFGFEPGNYEGRKYPKRYYLFDVKVVPTEKYMYDEDLPIIKQSKAVPIPNKGPLGEIPVWCDFFGNFLQGRWVEYLCMVAFALSVKGPMTARGAVDLLQPVIEEFEAQLIMDWLGTMGLLEKVAGGTGWTVGEWWWLVAGSQIDVKGKGVAEE